jgi:hypothetical protein
MANKEKLASKNKHTIQFGLRKLTELINQINNGIFDGSNSANKSWKEKIQSKAKYKNKV